MNKYFKGIIIGLVAGIVNCVFLLFAKDIEITVYISTFITWTVIGLLISSVDFKINSVLKGTIVSLLVSLPSLVYTLSSTIIGTIWTFLTTLFIGAFLGYIIKN